MCGIDFGLQIFAQIRHHLDGLLDLPCELCPFDVLQAYAHEVKQACAVQWPQPVPATAVEDAIEDEEPTITVSMVWPAVGEAVTCVKCCVGVSGTQLLEAERKLGTLDFDHVVTVDGLPMDLTGQRMVPQFPALWICP